MATVSQIVTRSLRRIGVVDALTTPASEDSAAGLSALNEMIDGWIASGVDVRHRQVFPTGFALSDTFWIFIPPALSDAASVEAMTYGGTWNASTNSPTLTDGSGTIGTFYRVATAGGTDLEEITDAWVVGDGLIFGRVNRGWMRDLDIISSDQIWMKGRHPVGYEGAIVAMLGLRLCEEYGIEPKPMLANDAMGGWSRIQAAYIIPGVPVYDAGIVSTPNRRRGWY